jgi:hypothetical protein
MRRDMASSVDDILAEIETGDIGSGSGDVASGISIREMSMDGLQSVSGGYPTSCTTFSLIGGKVADDCQAESVIIIIC